MIRYIKDIDARSVCGGDACGGGHACAPASAFEQKQVTKGKSPAGTKPADKSGSTSSTGDQSTHS